MDYDLILMIGIVLGVFSVPAFLSAISDSRPPRASLLCLLLAGSAIVFALTQNPGGYTAQDIPRVVIEQFSRLL